MLVDLGAIVPDLGIGLALTAIAVLGKVVGAGFPALFAGFTRVGAIRVGVGMIPRGEVALVVAGIGLARGVIDTPLFSIAVLIAVLTTVITPFPLVRAFRLEGWGTRTPPGARAHGDSVRALVLPPGLGTLFETHLLRSLAHHGWQQAGSWTDSHGTRGLELRREGILLSLVMSDAVDGRHIDLESEVDVADDLRMVLRLAAEEASDEVAVALSGARGEDAPEPRDSHVDLPIGIG